jgi:hypothetical protein
MTLLLMIPGKAGDVGMMLVMIRTSLIGAR